MSAISSVSSASSVQSAAPPPPPPATAKVDSDGDHDGSKPSSGATGRKVNVTA